MLPDELMTINANALSRALDRGEVTVLMLRGLVADLHDQAAMVRGERQERALCEREGPKMRLVEAAARPRGLRIVRAA